MEGSWDPAAEGVLRLPSGRLIRGRGLRRAPPPGPEPTFARYLRGSPPPVEWDHVWLRWLEFWLPADRTPGAAGACDAWQRAATGRVEVACDGGRGRTGTATACLAVVDGVPADEVIAFVRRHYHPKAVETLWQRRYVRSFRAP